MDIDPLFWNNMLSNSENYTLQRTQVVLHSCSTIIHDDHPDFIHSVAKAGSANSVSILAKMRRRQQKRYMGTTVQHGEHGAAKAGDSKGVNS